MYLERLKVVSPDTPLANAGRAVATQRHRPGFASTDPAPRAMPIQGIRPFYDPLSQPGVPLSSSLKSAPGIAQTINQHLIRSCALLASDQPELGLESADKAFEISQGGLVFDMMCKSQLYRGLCLMELSKWKEASKAFTRAANVRGWAWKVAELKSLAEKNLLEEKSQLMRRRAGGR